MTVPRKHPAGALRRLWTQARDAVTRILPETWTTPADVLAAQREHERITALRASEGSARDEAMSEASRLYIAATKDAGLEGLAALSPAELRSRDVLWESCLAKARAAELNS